MSKLSKGGFSLYPNGTSSAQEEWNVAVLEKLCELAGAETDPAILECLETLKTLVQELIDKPDFETVKTGWYCKEDTQTWACDFVFYADGEEVNRATEDSGRSCEEPQPQDIELKQVRSCVDGFEQIQFCYIAFVDGVPGENVNVGDPIQTEIPCGKQTVDIETCDGTEPAEVDHVVALAPGAVITTKPCPVVEVTYDHELACVDGSLSLITTITKGDESEAQDPVPFEPAIDCTNADDFELVTLCGSDGFVQVFAYDSSDLSEPVGKLNTGEPCDACQPFTITEYWKLEGGVAGVNGSRWQANSAPHGPVDTMFDGCGNHINGAADEVIIYPNWNLADTPSRFPLTGSDFGTSQEFYNAWVYAPEGFILEDNNGNTGEFIKAYVGGKNQKPVFQAEASNTNRNNRGIGEIGSYGPGLYKIAVELSDFSVYGGVNLRWSFDGGNTFAPITAANIYSEPPTVTCVKVRVNCDGSMQTRDGLPFNPDLPNCSECEILCPVIDDTVIPRDIEFQTVLGCDDIDGDPANYVNVTQETLIVDGEITVTFYTDYGIDDDQAEYTLQGTFVDCASGLPIEEPPIIVNCADWEIVNVYDVIGTNGVNVERWNTNAITGEPVTTVPSDVFTGAPDYSGMPAHDNGAPDGPIVVETDLAVFDNVSDQSQMRGWTYLYAPEPIRLREFHPRAEAADYFLGECCAAPTLAATGAYPNNDENNVAFDVSLATGIHYVGFEVFDFSAFSGMRYQYSTDNGVTWLNVPAAWLFTTKPAISQCAMKVCPETGLIAEIRTGVLNTTASLCEPILCVAADAVPDQNKAIAVLESCDGSTMYGIDCEGSVVWQLPNPSERQ